MQQLNWDRVSVMVVDDNKFARDLLETTLRSLGIEHIVMEEDGATAIKRLKLSTVDPIRAGIGTIDLILSDYLMTSVDGNLFLRWIRTGEQVPDRFVPFIMVSGAADREVVEQARDAGVTEFLAKPFSAKGVAERIMQVINKPRPFVLARGYFGPDRRRSEMAVEHERRETGPSQIQVLHRESNEKTLREDVRAIHFNIPNKLRDKLGQNAMRGEIGLDPLIIQAAEARIQSMVGDYTDWVRNYIDEMHAAQASLVVAPPDEEGAEPNRVAIANRRYIADINRIAHELRGQGGIFNYPLITAFGKSLYKATSDPTVPVTNAWLKLIGAHVDAIRTVFKNKIKGDGGEVGSSLLEEISKALQCYKGSKCAPEAKVEAEQKLEAAEAD